jgi:triphosphoribosyl-dephospho-CoA synthase
MSGLIVRARAGADAGAKSGFGCHLGGHSGKQPGLCHAADLGSRLGARLAVRSLHAELLLFPKPGLVSGVDSGSHSDMDAQTFMRSLFSLRHYFRQITLAGAQDADFATLRELGIAAEARMLAATSGVNTHRGAIFALGLLCAALGRAHASANAISGSTFTLFSASTFVSVSPSALQRQLRERWGQDLAHHAASQNGRAKAVRALSHGLQVRARYAVAGAREQAAQGLPAVFDLALPTLQRSLKQGQAWQAAALETLFTLMAHVHDSNVLYRAGRRGMDLVRGQAQLFLAQGGCAAEGWHARALACHRLFVANRLSPGGVADLFAATCFVHFASGGL